MARQTLNSDTYHVPVEGFSQAVVTDAPGRLVFVSGLTARTADGDVAGTDAGIQARHILESLGRILGEAGAGLDDVVRIVTYLVDMNDHRAVHAVRREYFGDDPPASTSVQVTRLFDERQLLEIEATAVLPAS
jgi:enamine deaminase RidA (YjgF/YER057c/UK114 family)